MRRTSAPRTARSSHRIKTILAAAVAAIAITPTIYADGTFDGDEVSLAQTRLWDVGGATPGLNWGLDTLPTPGADALTFSICGDGTIDLGGAVRGHPTAKFDSWVTYTLAGGPGSTLALGGAFSSIGVGASVGSTNGSEYFADGSTIAADLLLGSATTIAFTDLTSGALRISGTISGLGALTITRPVAGATGIRPVYFDSPNAGYGAAVTITTGTAARLLGAGRTGAGAINLQGGNLDILSEVPQLVGNGITSALGAISADHNYTAAPTPPFAPGIVHTLGLVVVDNPTLVGGTSAAAVTFTSNNGYNFATPVLVLANAAGIPAVGTRTVTVNNGNISGGYAGSVRLTGPNDLNSTLVTTTIGAPGAAAALFDFNPAAGVGMPLIKAGTGVLVINGDNSASSSGAKLVTGGVLRFTSPLSYGTVAGLPVAVTLAGGPGAVSAAMGVGYPTPIPANLLTTGVIPGQSGVFDIDFVGNPAPVLLPVGGIGGTAYRVGSSGIGSKVGAAPITPYTSPAGVNTYFVGGGGGALTISTVMGPGPGPVTTNLEMGTSGLLKPGLVALSPGVIGFGGIASAINIRAGTLQPLAAAFPFPGVGGTSLGAYSTGLSTGSAYVGAPAATPFNGPGQLLLDAAIQAGGGYVYVPGGGFGGATGLTHSGGALGYTGPAFLPAPPIPAGGAPLPGSIGVWGAPLLSALSSSIAVPTPPVPTNILHLGGEASGPGPMLVGFVIANNPGLAPGPIDDVPVALIKSGLASILDLTAMPVHTYTGGTGIMGGEVIVNAAPQLSTGPVVIADGGTLHIAPLGPPPVFANLLRVANGPGARSSRIMVDPGVIATFTGAFFVGGSALEADTVGSVLEKTGPGALNIYPAAAAPVVTASAANTWGIKATDGLVSINQMPGTTTPSNGQAIFDGGIMGLVGTGMPGVIPIPAATQFSANYGFGALSSYAGTASGLTIGPDAFFRITGGQAGDWMGTVGVTMTPTSVFKVAGNAAGGHTRGTGKMLFFGGNVQFTPGGGNILMPRDGAFTLSLNAGAQFSGCSFADLNGNLIFSEFAAGTVYIDGATVSNAPAPAADTWTIGGTGLTNWNGTVIKTNTQAFPGGPGPFTTGIVSFNRCKGAPVIVTAGSVLQIDSGVVNAGDNGDPFLDNSGLGTTGNLVEVQNNSAGPGTGVPPARGFNITAGSKHVGKLTVTGFAPAAPALGTSATSVYDGASLTADHVRQAVLDIHAASTVSIRPDGGSPGTSRVKSLTIAGGTGAWTGKIDLADNDLIYDYTGGGTPIVDVANQIKTAHAGGAWTGNGITTSLGDVATHALGYGENSVLGFAMFDGQAVNGTTLLVKYTYYADGNLDGKVNLSDLVLLSTNWQTAGPWYKGDWNYDGTINLSDLVLLAGNWQKGITNPPPLGPSFEDALASVGLSGALVPEPASAILFGALAAWSLHRPSPRRRRKTN